MSSKQKTDFFENKTYYKNGSSKKELVSNKSSWNIKVFDAKEDWGKFSLRIIDEIGRERNPIKGEIEIFPAYVDWCEKNNIPIFICSNLPGEKLIERYGLWTINRIKKNSVVIVFEGESLR